MARLEEGLHGGINGKLDEIVYQTNHGNGEMEIVARSKADRDSPSSPEMVEQREDLKTASEEWKLLSQDVRDYVKREPNEGVTARTKYIQDAMSLIDDSGNLTRQPRFIRVAQEELSDSEDKTSDTIITDFEQDNFSDWTIVDANVSRKQDRVSTGSYSGYFNIKADSHAIWGDDVFPNLPKRGDTFRVDMNMGSDPAKFWGPAWAVQDTNEYYGVGIDQVGGRVSIRYVKNTSAVNFQVYNVQVELDTWITIEIRYDIDGSGDIEVDLWPTGSPNSQYNNNPLILNDSTLTGGGFGIEGQLDHSAYMDNARLVKN